VLVVIAVAASANELFEGRVKVNQIPAEQAKNQRPDKSDGGNRKPRQNDSLVERYGGVASSSIVASAILEVETAGVAAAKAKLASDRLEALEHSYEDPRMNPINLIPGMPEPVPLPHLAAMQYGLPKPPRMPQPITPDMIDRMAGMPDSRGAVLQTPGLTPEQIAIQNQILAEQAVRAQMGPVLVPALQRDHNWTRQPSSAPSIRESAEQSGNIVAEYDYDPFGRVKKLQGNTVDSDFGYAGMYVHQRSGLNLAVHRAYSPTLGRFISRDPIDDPDFRNGRRFAPDAGLQPNTPSISAASATSSATDNLYAYVYNNPISLTDPSGLSPYFRCCKTTECCEEMWQKCIDYGGSLTCCTAVEVACHLYTASGIGGGKSYGNLGWNSCYRQRPKNGGIKLPPTLPSPGPIPPLLPFLPPPGPIPVPILP
jgi:RHS repeat-associated protein